MTRGLKLVFGAALLVLIFMSTTSYAGEKPVSMKWVGTVTDTGINVNGDAHPANLIDAQAKGSFCYNSNC